MKSQFRLQTNAWGENVPDDLVLVEHVYFNNVLLYISKLDHCESFSDDCTFYPLVGWAIWRW